MIGPSINRFVPRPGSLGARTIRAGLWSLVQVGALHVLRLGSNLIMTRLLVPEAFGLIALVGTVVTAFALFSDIGISRSIVRERDGADPYFLQAAWTVKILRGGIIAGGVLVAALLLGLLGPRLAAEGTVYADPRLPWLIAISAFAPFMQGFESTKRELALRRIQMGRLSAVEIGAQVTSITAMVVFASLSPTVWALLAGMLVNFAAKSAGSHLFLPGPSMRLIWDAEIADRLWQFGKWLMGSSIFTFFARNADRFILGALLPAGAFGIYVIARIWIDAGQQVIQRLGDQVGFSTIGEVIRDRPADAARLYRKFQTVMDVLCLSAALALFVLGQPLIDLLYTETYAEAGSYLRILALGLLALRFDPLNGLVMNIGNSRAMMGISALRAAALCVSLPLAYDAFGLTGALFAVALSPLASVPLTLWVLRPVLGRQLVLDAAWVGLILAMAAATGLFSG